MTVRKWFNAFGALGSAVCFFFLRFLSPCEVGDSIFDRSCHDYGVAIALTTLAVALSATTIAGGYNVNFLDLSPRFSGHIYGISNSFASIPGIVGQLVTGAILAGRDEDWGLVFLLPAVMNVAGTVVFSIWARSDVIFD